jgi:hypothetical protein
MIFSYSQKKEKEKSYGLLLLVNGLSNGALENYGFSIGLNSWEIQELSENLDLENTMC